jgi:tRNA1Val (adenine37-N6)-methyltransferase
MSFTFKQFFVADDQCAMKVGSDGSLLGAWADVSNARTILDIGTGCGLIALTHIAAKLLPSVKF